jgi:acetate kinase
LLASAGCFYGSVQCKQISLECYVVDETRNLSNFFRSLVNVSHCRNELSHFILSLPGSLFGNLRNIGSLAAALGGLDGIVFTAGVGENAVPIRAAICAACAWLGVELDAAANEAGGPRITAPGSRVVAFVIPTEETLMIARQTRALLG